MSSSSTGLAKYLAFIVIGFDRGNSFWSDYAKQALGPEPWTWTIENQALNLAVQAFARGGLPNGHWPQLTQNIHDGFGSILSLSNWFALIRQVLAIVADLRIAWWDITEVITRHVQVQTPDKSWIECPINE